eukprot:TRINITY_DN8771_c0_g1_i1.p1 TRINITY_DN8771_c0_g1~~TRINITY_DN8771_c0_g1_i1.p1  ORF type:complete len:556 (+),score=134.51 TRINITY_DN8771_c0_g1_i1:75-1742(+)
MDSTLQNQSSVNYGSTTSYGRDLEENADSSSSWCRRNARVIGAVGVGVVALVLVIVLVIVPALSSSSSSSDRLLRFPIGFEFGSATASYQVEGAAYEDGRGLSIWDTFSHTPGKVANNDTGDVSDDHYHKYLQDIQLMKKMNVTFYRFSIAPSRILPTGELPVNQKGIDFYNRLIDGLLEQGIKPFVTLYHWDLQNDLHEKYGGWLNRSSVGYFTLYADACFAAFGDRVQRWLTFNEPWTFAYQGYGNGVNAPGRCSDRNRCDAGDSLTEPYIVAHNVLLAHAYTVQTYRQKYQQKQKGEIGMTLNCDFGIPLNPHNASDVAATQRYLEFFLGWYADPLYFGDYPASMRAIVGDRLPRFSEEESRLLQDSKDFFGINSYTTTYVYDQPNPIDTEPGWITDMHLGRTYYRDGKPIGPRADSSWLYVYPPGIGALLRWIDSRYHRPIIFVTENGCDVPDESLIPMEQALNDTFRIDYYRGYLTHVLDALNDGVDVRGYTMWSLLDNFEWADGYSKRFGLHYVDYNDPELKRYAKASVGFLSDVIARKVEFPAPSVNE